MKANAGHLFVLVPGLTAFAAACGGTSDTNLITPNDSGTDSGGGRPDSGRPPGDSGHHPDGRNPGDGGGPRDTSITCEAGLADCGGTCVDTKSDPMNCGGCGVNCTGGSCSGGICNLIGGTDAGCNVTPQVGDQACIGLDSKFVYWGTGLAATMGGAVLKVPVSGGCAVPLAGNQANPHAVASDGTTVFWTLADFTNNMGGIAKSDTTGGGLKMIVMGQAGHPYNIAIDASHVFWTQEDGSVWQAAHDGSGLTTLQPASSVSPGTAGAGYITSGGGKVYWTDPGGGHVLATPIGGGKISTLASSQMGPDGIALGAKDVFWTDRASGAVMSLALGGGAPSTFASGQTGAAGIALDSASAYWATFGASFGVGTVAKAALGGGTPTTLASSLKGPNCVAVDATSVYWIENGGALISKTGK